MDQRAQEHVHLRIAGYYNAAGIGQNGAVMNGAGGRLTCAIGNNVLQIVATWPCGAANAGIRYGTVRKQKDVGTCDLAPCMAEEWAAIERLTIIGWREHLPGAYRLGR